MKTSRKTLVRRVVLTAGIVGLTAAAAMGPRAFAGGSPPAPAPTGAPTGSGGGTSSSGDDDAPLVIAPDPTPGSLLGCLDDVQLLDDADLPLVDAIVGAGASDTISITGSGASRSVSVTFSGQTYAVAAPGIAIGAQAVHVANALLVVVSSLDDAASGAVHAYGRIIPDGSQLPTSSFDVTSQCALQGDIGADPISGNATFTYTNASAQIDPVINLVEDVSCTRVSFTPGSGFSASAGSCVVAKVPGAPVADPCYLDPCVVGSTGAEDCSNAGPLCAAGTSCNVDDSGAATCL